MRRILAILSATLVVLLACGFLALGAFPPKPVQQPTHVTVATAQLAPA